MVASAAAIRMQYVPQSDVYIQFIDHHDNAPQEDENLQLEWHAPPSIYDEYDTENGEFKTVFKEGDELIPADKMDKFWIPNYFFPTEGVYNTHNGKYPGQQKAAYDKTETEPENTYDLVKKDWQKW